MPFLVIRQDITRIPCDAIVNAANTSLLGGGGVDGAIHRAAGPKLLEECIPLHGCETGDAKVTRAYNITTAKYIIHTVGPIWEGGNSGEEDLLRSCYRNSLARAAELGCESVAFPLISGGIYGYPKDQAVRVAAEEVRAFLGEHDMTVYLCLFPSPYGNPGKEILGRDLYGAVEACLYGTASLRNAHAVPAADRFAAPKTRKNAEAAKAFPTGIEVDDEEISLGSVPAPRTARRQAPEAKACYAPEGFPDLEERLKYRDESFQEMLFRKIDEKGMTDAECYKRANIDRRLFSKIRADREYRPHKTTALAFAVALELPLPETREFLLKAGYALSDSSTFDIILKWFIERGEYDIDTINYTLFSFDQSILGANG